MSTQQTLTVVGFVVGSYFGYPVLGSTIGSMVGAAMTDGPQTHGPRLNDRAVQNATEGVGIPIDFGAMRHAGTVLWSTELRERAHEDDVGGKGGSPATNTTYTYDVDLAVMFCAGPIVGIRRMWADSKLIYDASAGAGPEAVVASQQWASGITFYAGTDTQGPDPTYESHYGAGNCPAYRGRAYVVFRDFQLGPFGNRVPNFTAEIVTVAAVQTHRRLLSAVIPIQFYRQFLSGGHSGKPLIFSSGDVVRVGSVSTSNGNGGELGGVCWVLDLEGNLLSTEAPTLNEALTPVQPASGTGYAVGITVDEQQLWQTLTPMPVLGSGAPALFVGGAWGVVQDLGLLLPAGRKLVSACMAADQRHVFVVTAPGTAATGSNSGDAWHLLAVDRSGATLVGSGSIASGVCGGGSTWFPYTYCFGPGAYTQAGQNMAMLESDLTHLWIGSSGVLYVYEIDTADVLRLLYTHSAASYDYPSSSTACAIYADRGVCTVVSDNNVAFFTRIPSLDPAPVPMGDIVSALCLRAGLTAGEIDVTRLTEPVRGYTVANQTSARAALEPLRSYRAFDVCEADGQLVFMPRGRAPVATLTLDDLAAHAPGSTPPDPITITCADETELPDLVTVVFPNVDASYQTGARHARRTRRTGAGQVWPIVTQQQTSRIELPIAMTPSDAARIASTLLWDAYAASKSVKFVVGPRWAALNVGDPVRILGDSASYLVRITRINEDGLRREMEGAFEDPEIYQSQPAAGVSEGVPDQSVTLAGPTRLLLVDVATLRDTDDGPGFLAAMGGYLDGWPGASLYASSDGGASWSSVAAVANSATLGPAATALGNWTGGNVFDEANSVTVTLAPGATLASVSLLNVLNGQNAALVGDELIQFRDATLVSARNYRLTGLRRGLRGTEGAMSSHVIGERFLLLSGVAGLLQVDASLAEIGQDRQYRAVTAGKLMSESSVETYAYAGNNLKPLAPIRIAGGRDAAGNILLAWVRQTRIGAEWRDYAGASLGEETEQYDIEIYNAAGTLLLDTLSSSTPSVSWLLSSQLASGDPVNDIRVLIYQRSARVGRGRAGLGQLSIPPLVPNSATVSRYAVVANAGGTLVATTTSVVGGGNVTRYWSSADHGQTWSQIGTDTPAPAVVESYPPERLSTLSSGAYVAFAGSSRGNGLDQPAWAGGTASTKPAATGAQLLGGYWPLCVTNDGSSHYAISEAGRVFKSTDGGATWVDKGALGGDFSQALGWENLGLSGERLIVTAHLRLHRAGGAWLLESISSYNDNNAGTATQKSILRTTDPDAVTGWVEVLKLRSGYESGYLDFPGRLGQAGSQWLTFTYGYVAGPKYIIWSSADDGATWSAETFTGDPWPGVYAAGLVGPYHVGSTTLFVSQGSAKGIKNAGSGWSAFTASGIPAFDVLGNIVSDGTRIVARSNTAAGLQMWSSSNGTSWTASTGITTT